MPLPRAVDYFVPRLLRRDYRPDKPGQSPYMHEPVDGAPRKPRSDERRIFGGAFVGCRHRAGQAENGKRFEWKFFDAGNKAVASGEQVPAKARTDLQAS